MSNSIDNGWVHKMNICDRLEKIFNNFEDEISSFCSDLKFEDNEDKSTMESVLLTYTHDLRKLFLDLIDDIDLIED